MKLHVLMALLFWASGVFAMEEPLESWRALRYGIFIHFGMSTFTGREIDPGDKPSATYAPTNLDVDQWIRVARDSGMKYAVLTSKHVAGHCLWDSKVQWRGKEFDYDVASSGNTTDVVAEFVKACRRYGILPGLYWCLLDFRNNSVPQQQQWNAGRLPEDFFRLAQDQLTELTQRYPEVGYYWLDIPRAASAEQRRVLYDLLKRLRPGTLVLFNHGTEQPSGPITIEKCRVAWPTDILNTERNPARPGQFNPDQSYEGKAYRIGYEHCDCLGKNWFWVEGDRAREIRELCRIYRDTIAAGGNLLLDVPPDRTGRIPEYHVAALLELKKAIEDPAAFPVSLTRNAKATASNVYRNEAAYQASAAVDEKSGTRWATDDGIQSAWLAVDLGRPVTIGRVVIEQAFPELQRIRRFVIEYRQGEEWRPCYKGEVLGPSLDVPVDPVTSQHFRLNILEATGGPTIFEFQLFPPAADRK